jgi:hypothetical protein
MYQCRYLLPSPYKNFFFSITHLSPSKHPFIGEEPTFVATMQFQSIVLALLTLSATALAGCGDFYGRDSAKCQANCPGTCYNRGGTAILFMSCGC